MEAAIGVGKRKTSVAIATVSKGTGTVRINRELLDTYSPELLRAKITEPLEFAGAIAKNVDIGVSVRGGGVSSRTDAIRTAIACALVEYTKDKNLKKTLKEYDRSILVSDMRSKETSKPGGRGARKKRQKSYR